MINNILVWVVVYLFCEKLIGIGDLVVKNNSMFETKKEFKIYMVIPFILIISFFAMCYNKIKDSYNQLKD